MIFTVAIDGRGDQAYLVMAVTGDTVIIANPPDGRLEAVPLDQCRVSERFLTAEQRIWWDEAIRRGQEAQQRAFQAAVDGADAPEVHELVPGPRDPWRPPQSGWAVNDG